MKTLVKTGGNDDESPKDSQSSDETTEKPINPLLETTTDYETAMEFISGFEEKGKYSAWRKTQEIDQKINHDLQDTVKGLEKCLSLKTMDLEAVLEKTAFHPCYEENTI